MSGDGLEASRRKIAGIAGRSKRPCCIMQCGRSRLPHRGHTPALPGATTFLDATGNHDAGCGQEQGIHHFFSCTVPGLHLSRRRPIQTLSGRMGKQTPDTSNRLHFVIVFQDSDRAVLLLRDPDQFLLQIQFPEDTSSAGDTLGGHLLPKLHFPTGPAEPARIRRI